MNPNLQPRIFTFYFFLYISMTTPKRRLCDYYLTTPTPRTCLPIWFFFPARLARARMDGAREPSSLQTCGPEGVKSVRTPPGSPRPWLEVEPRSGSNWRHHSGVRKSAAWQVRRRGLQSTRRTATSMPAPAAGAANGLAVLSRASRPQPRPRIHWRRPCALIWSIWSPVS